MTTLATLLVKLTADTSEFSTRLEAAGKLAEKVGKGLSSAGKTLTAAVTLPLIGMGVASVNAASDLEESMSKVNVVFGDSAEAVVDFSKTTAGAMGVSQQAALAAAGTFGNLFVTMGVGEDASADMSTSLVGLAADLASFNNLGTEDVLQKLQSGLVGQAEPLRALGVNLTEAAVQAKAMEMGLADASGVLSEGAKVQARYALILEQTTTAQGDFARTADGLANSTRIAKAQLADAAAALGQQLLPYALQAVNKLKDLVTWFTSLDENTKKTIVTIAGIAAALGPVLLILGQTITTVGSVIGAVQTAQVAMAAMNLTTVAALGPIALVAAAVVALTGVLIAYNKVQKQVTQGTQETQDAWGTFFEQQISQGKSAYGVISAYADKQDEIREIYNSSSIAVRALMGNQDKFLTSSDKLAATVKETGASYADYARLMMDADLAAELLTAEQYSAIEVTQELSEAQITAITETGTYMSDNIAMWTEMSNTTTEAATVIVENTEEMTRRAGLYEAAMERSERANDSFAGSMWDTGQTATQMFDAMNTGLDTTIASWISKIAWMEGGGLELEAQFETVKNMLLAGTITPEQADSMFSELYVATQTLQTDIGALDAATAAQNIADTLGVSLEDATKIYDDLKANIAAGVTGYANIVITTTTVEQTLPETTTSVTTSSGQWENDPYENQPPPNSYAEGGSGVVPPGYPGDSYPIWLTSGEAFSVTPAGEPGSGGVNVTIYQTNYGGNPEQAKQGALDGVTEAMRAVGKA